MSQPQVNGEVSPPSSRCIHHLSQYPIVKDGVDMVMSNSWGQWSIERGSYIYSRFTTPAFMRPYIHKADEYGDKALSALDEKFPVTKKPTDELVNDARTLAMRPKEHVAQVYREEQQRAGDGLMASGSAIVHTALALGTQLCSKTYSYLRGQQSAASEKIRQQANGNGHAKGSGSSGNRKSNGPAQ